MDRPELTLTQSVDDAHAALQCRVQNARPATSEPITITLDAWALRLLREYRTADLESDAAYVAWRDAGMTPRHARICDQADKRRDSRARALSHYVGLLVDREAGR